MRKHGFGGEERWFLMSEAKKWLRPGLDTIIHYVTSRCNAQCDHCYFLDRLNKKNDLSKEEQLKFIDNVGPLKALLIGGGEPFISNDLAEIVISYVRKCGVRFTQIPTMAYHAVKMETSLNTILTECPELNLTVNVSIDGFENFHNENRHVPELFKKAIQNMKNVAELQKKYQRLRLCVVTVMMPQNFYSLKEFAHFIQKNVDPDCHILEIMRAKEYETTRPSWRKDTEDLLSYWKELTRYYYNKEKVGSKNFYANRFLRKKLLSFALNNLDTAFLNFLNNRPWPMNCVAGKRIAVMYPEGDLAACELRKRIQNVRDFDFDINAALQSSAFQDEVRKIPQDKCFCTHGCFIPPSVRYSPLMLTRLLFWGEG